MAGYQLMYWKVSEKKLFSGNFTFGEKFNLNLEVFCLKVKSWVCSLKKFEFIFLILSCFLVFHVLSKMYIQFRNFLLFLLPTPTGVKAFCLDRFWPLPKPLHSKAFFLFFLHSLLEFNSNNSIQKFQKNSFV